jgi:hypothetical protein
MEYVCARCGERHDGLPFAYDAPAPAIWTPELAEDPNSELDAELCVVRDEHFFVHGRIQLPVHDHDQPFEWGVWTSLSEDSFKRTVDVWEIEGREQEPPLFGWLSTELPLYPVPTLGLATDVRTRPVGERPLIALHPTDHPLAVEQREGITLARVIEIAAFVLHDADPPR